ncbi:mas-related G-protein coupled receptor member A-like [Perognathus longimembris pacificus]|uniref:mas-related G-protein coupled receptor member A-like n=1 Tax=Perognathus longimembris pacificus TaxID=214514 RepID=UPI002019406A|nr:mas-related G-protein coupled receptor member A-like [Perognathus longimembris pacificus]
MLLIMNPSGSSSGTEPTPVNGTAGNVPGSFNSKILIPNVAILLSALVGLAGNGVVLWLLGFRMRRNSFSVYILNLAAADFLFLCCHAIDSTLVLVKFSHPAVVFLPCFTTVMMVPYIAGLSMLSAISTQRCLSVLCPVWYRCRRPKHTSTVMCALLWVQALLFGILNRYYCGFLDKKYESPQCLASNFCVAACLMFLFVMLSASSGALLGRVLCGAGKMKLTRLYVTILLTVLVFLLCGMPFGIHWFLLIWIQIDFSAISYGLYLTSVVLSSVNSCANPIIYFFVGSFRQQLKKQTLKLLLQRALQDTPEGEGGGSSLPQGTLEVSVSKGEP